MKQLCLTIATAVACVVSVSAQNAEPPAVVQIIREAIKEGRTAAHERVETDYARAFRKAKFPFHYIALTSMTGPGEVWFLNAFPSFAAFEQADQEFQKPAFKSETDLLDARDGELRSSSRSMIAVYRKDLSYRPDLAHLSKSRYMMVEMFRLKLGKMEEFMAGSKTILDAQAKANSKIPAIAYEVMAGVPDGLILFLSPLESLKPMDEMPAMEKALMEAMGGPEKFGQFMKSAGEVFTSMETSFFSINPKMSYPPKEMEDADPAFWRPKAPVKPAEKAGQ